MANKLGYVKQGNFEKKTYGIGTVKAGKNKVKVSLHTKDEGDKEFFFGFDDLPKIPKIAPETEGEYNIVLSADGDSVEKLGPVEGRYLAVLHDFVRPEDDAEPAPQLIEKTDSSGKKYSYEQFMVDFKIIKGKFKGVLIRHWLRYLFVENPDEPGYAGWKGDKDNPNAKWLPRLVDFCDKIGATDEELEWPEDGNVLPEILRRGLEAEKTVDLTIKNGFVSDILAADYEDAEDEDVEEVKPKGKKFNKPTDAPKQGSYKTTAKKSKKAVDEDEDL